MMLKIDRKKWFINDKIGGGKIDQKLSKFGGQN
jgi:hypothetical protein